MPESHNSGVLLIDLQGLQLTTEEKQRLLLDSVAGVVLFSRNYQNREQLCLLTRAIRDLRHDLLICVDQEGGRVQRFKEGFTRLPSAMTYSHYDQDTQQKVAHEAGWLMASELLACGVDLCLGPVLDIDQGRTDIVGNRAFGNSHDQVIQLASAWIDGVHDAGMSVVIKHFPGHGNVDDDSHLGLPVDHRSLEVIEQSDLQPFKAMISKGVGAVMPAHILFPAIDKLPAGFSSNWLKTILREKLGYKGLIISDCLSMEGAAIA
nr:beta-N-acetylhexosaminidase [Endozoicomonas sp.]